MTRVWVHAKPGARTEGVERRADGTWLVKVRAAAVDGKANERLCEVVADHLGCRTSDVRIVTGLASRRKLIEVPDRRFFVNAAPASDRRR